MILLLITIIFQLKANAADDIVKMPVANFHVAPTSEPSSGDDSNSPGNIVPSAAPESPVPSSHANPSSSGAKKIPAVRAVSILETLPKQFGRIQILPSTPAGEELTLPLAISKAIANNRTLLGARLSLKGAEIGYANAWDTMYMPSINLSMNSSNSLTIGHIPGPLNDQNGNSLDTHGFPTQSLTLALADYTLFNFWKDFNTFEQARLDWVRTNEQYKEQVRALRNQVITGFFRTKAEAEKLEASQRSVVVAEAFVSVVKSQVRVNKASENDISSSEVDLLNAKNAYSSQLTTAQVQLWNFNNLLGDPIGTPYVMKEKIKFIPIVLTAEEALRIYMENAPNMKDRRRDLKKAELSLDLAHKNRLPLPKVAFSGISLNYNNVYNTITPTFASSAYNANMNISGSVSLSLPLVGPGGLFNNRVIEQTQIALDQANLAFLNTTNQDELSIVQGIRTVLQSENNVKNNSEAFEKSLSILEKLSENLTSGTINRLELRDAINNSRNYELNLEDSKVQHLQSKMDLAQLIGVDKLPGDPYP